MNKQLEEIKEYLRNAHVGAKMIGDVDIDIFREEFFEQLTWNILNKE